MGGPLLMSQVRQHIWQRHSSYSGIEVVVETGTYSCAETAIELSPYFKKVITIELLRERYMQAVKAGGGRGNIEFYCGDSAVLLPEILSKLDAEAVLFYFDAHSDFGNFNVEDTPLHRELEAINKWRRGCDVVVVDDVRCFALYRDSGITEKSILAYFSGRVYDEFIVEDKMFIFLQ